MTRRVRRCPAALRSACWRWRRADRPRTAAAQGWVPQRVAELQALDKVTARVTVLRVPVDQPAQFGTLTIARRACNARPAGRGAGRRRLDGDHRQPRRRPTAAAVFRGWMFANAPGVSMLEHPVYDIRVLECRNS